MAALFSHFSAGSDIRTNFFQFLNFGQTYISSKKSFITSTTAEEDEDIVTYIHERKTDTQTESNKTGGTDKSSSYRQNVN